MKLENLGNSNYSIFKGKSKKTTAVDVKQTNATNVLKNNSATINNGVRINSAHFANSISFQRKWKEHTSWGAVVNPKTKDVSFKLFTFPDAKNVKVNIEDKDTGNIIAFSMENKGKGIFQTSEPILSILAKEGDSYFYTIEKADGEIVNVKDPYSFKQDQLLDKSVIYDHSRYQWQDKDWYSNKNRITRTGKNNTLKLNEARIYEMNLATYSKTGDFSGAIAKLDEVVKDGFNAVEIMPLENTASFNWGYDGVDKFAVSSYLGGPDEAKKFADEVHKRGLNLIIDMVPNHHGPDGSQLGMTGPYFSGPNDFGDAYNYEGKDSTYVRDFMVNAALNWINNYHCDGIRFDMTKYMQSDKTMKQIAAEINYHNPDVFLIAEDSRAHVKSDGENFWDDNATAHDLRVMQQLKPFEYGENKSEKVHNEAIEEIINGSTNLARLGYDSEWDFNYYHVLKDNLYGNSNLDAFADACIQGEGRVKYVMSHDEIGNFEGSRLIAKLIVPMLHLNENVSLDDEDIKRAKDLAKLKGIDIDKARQNVTFQKAQFVAEKIAIAYITGHLDKYFEDNDTQALYDEVLSKLGVHSKITPRRLKFAFDKAFSANKMALALTYIQKGPKMVFQGDESASLSPFRFFRQFDSIKHEPYLYTEKGYKPGKSALKESMLDSVITQKQQYKDGFENLIRDLNKLVSENKAITNGRIVQKDTVKHYGSQVIALHTKDDETKNDLYTIANFSDLKYPRDDADEYYINFPKGTWVEILNTDDERYCGFNYTNKNPIISDGVQNLPISLGNRATLIFKKID